MSTSIRLDPVESQSKRHPLRILIESGHERNLNRGDEAHFASLVNMLKEGIPGVELRTFSIRPERVKKRYGVDTVYFGKGLWKTSRNVGEMLKAIQWCDVYLWGSGQILRDDTGLKSPIYRLFRPLLAQLFGKKVIAFSIGVGPLETKRARSIARRVLNGFNVITTRDPYSSEVLECLELSNPEIVTCADPAFTLKPAPRDHCIKVLKDEGIELNGRPLVGIVPFGIAFKGKRSIFSQEFQKKLGLYRKKDNRRFERYVACMAKLGDYVVQHYGARLFFIGMDPSWQGQDQETAHQIIQKMEKGSECHVLSGDPLPEVLKGMLGLCDAVIGSRMHALILAAGMGRPVGGICFEEKLRAFVELVGQEQYFLDEHGIEESDELIIAFEKLWLDRKTITTDMEGCIPKLQEKAMESLRSLQKTISGRTH